MATVLVVEDAPASLALVTKLLLSAGHRVLSAATGTEGVALALEHRPDLVLLDLRLPDVDGWEVLRRLRAGSDGGRTPVVAVTAHAMRGDRERALAAGFDDYLTKPIDVATFSQSIGRLLS